MAVTIILKSGEKIVSSGKASPQDIFRSMSTGPGSVISITEDNGRLTGFILCSEVAAVLEAQT